MDCSPADFSVHGLFQAKLLVQVAIPPPADLPDPGMELTSFTSPALASGFFTTSATWEAQESQVASTSYLQSGWEAQENGLASTSYLQGGWGKGLLLTFHRLDSSGCFKRCLGKSKARAWCRDLKLRSISKCPDSGCEQGFHAVKCPGNNSEITISSSHPITRWLQSPVG